MPGLLLEMVVCPKHTKKSSCNRKVNLQFCIVAFWIESAAKLLKPCSSLCKASMIDRTWSNKAYPSNTFCTYFYSILIFSWQMKWFYPSQFQWNGAFLLVRSVSMWSRLLNRKHSIFNYPQTPNLPRRGGVCGVFICVNCSFKWNSDSNDLNLVWFSTPLSLMIINDIINFLCLLNFINPNDY